MRRPVKVPAGESAVVMVEWLVILLAVLPDEVAVELAEGRTARRLPFDFDLHHPQLQQRSQWQYYWVCGWWWN